MESTNLSKLWDGWKPPEGLNRSWPRPTALTASGILLYVLATLLPVGGVVGAAYIARESRHRQAEVRRMLAEGRETEAVVTRLWRGGGKSEEHRVAYRFAVDGRDRTGSATIGGGHWKLLQVGSTIPVRYLPSAPAHNYPSADPPGPVPVWLALLAGVAGALGGALLPLRVKRQRHLLEGGRAAPALVTRLRNIHSQHGTQSIVYYQFALPDGGVCKGRSSVHGKPTPKDSVICILYDPDNPRRSAPYPLCSVKLVTY